MEDAVYALQQVFENLNLTQLTQTASNATASANPTSQLAMPSLSSLGSISSLITFLFSFSALRDWLKLFLIGGFFETFRRLSTRLYTYVVSLFFINAHFEQDDSSFDWMMFWLAGHSEINKSRNIGISTRSFGHHAGATAMTGDFNPNGGEEDTGTSGSKYILKPHVSTTYSMWYKGHRMTIVRERQQQAYGESEDTLTITIMAWSPRILGQLLQEAKREYFATREHNISIYTANTYNDWRFICSRPKRSLNSIVLEPGIKSLIVDDAKDFLASKPWYTSRGIPFRRGYLLYGAPGSGKTSIIHSLAGELQLDVYIVNLSRMGLDDAGLNELISELPERCIALMEDIDAAFHHGLNRDESSGSNSDPSKGPPAPKSTASESVSKVTLSGLLNALDGIGAQEGRILFATTNKYGSLDPALCRPGRMDIHVEFKLASQFQAKELYTRFYLPDDEQETTGEKDKKSDEEVNGSDSGYSSSQEQEDLLPNLPSTSSVSEKDDSSSVSFKGVTHTTRAPVLSPAQVNSLATRFSQLIPEREVSMASLQGYLMTHKTRPVEAVEGVTQWIQSESESKKAREASQNKQEAQAEEKKEEETKTDAEEKEEDTSVDLTSILNELKALKTSHEALSQQTTKIFDLHSKNKVEGTET